MAVENFIGMIALEKHVLQERRKTPTKYLWHLQSTEHSIQAISRYGVGDVVLNQILDILGKDDWEPYHVRRASGEHHHEEKVNGREVYVERVYEVYLKRTVRDGQTPLTKTQYSEDDEKIIF